MIPNAHANPYPPHTVEHSYFHLWKSEARAATRAASAARQHQEAAAYYLDQLLECARNSKARAEIEATAVAVMP